MQEIKRNKKQVSLREEFMREYLFSVTTPEKDMMPAAMMESISLRSVFRSNSVIIICIPFVKNRPALTAGRRRVCYGLGRKCQEGRCGFLFG